MQRWMAGAHVNVGVERCLRSAKKLKSRNASILSSGSREVKQLPEPLFSAARAVTTVCVKIDSMIFQVCF